MVSVQGNSGPVFAIRPLVRYVDEQQGVVDIHFTAKSLDSLGRGEGLSVLPITVCIRLEGPEGFVCEQETQLLVRDRCGAVRFEMDDPKRWWPSGMGDQALYELGVFLLIEDELADQWQTTIGLTSVRTVGGESSQISKRVADEATSLLINGRKIDIQTVVPVDPADEQNVLPVVEHCLLVVRGHYGPDLLYDAADRAGTLLVQSIPDDSPSEQHIQTQIDRLAGHPSLAGWLVPQRNRDGDEIASHVHALDPTRNVFRHLPGS